MSFPIVTFRKSAKKDFRTLRAFTKDASYDNGRNLRWAVFNKYPQLKIYFDKNRNYTITEEESLRSFIDRFYQTNQKAMDESLMLHKKQWEKIAPIFFSLVDELFNKKSWPPGKYIAYGTIWGMYPRFIEDKTFQIPFQHDTQEYISVIIAHELLHFMFYDYLYSRYPKYRHSKYNYFVWNISEIFNTIIQNSPLWLDYFKLKSLDYPEHKEIIKKIIPTFHCRNKWNLDLFVNKIIREVKNNTKE